MKVFVTGATGYIGGSIVERLEATGHQVSGLVRSEGKIPLLKGRGIDPVVGTLDDPEILTKAAQAADAVIHAASADHSGCVVTLVTALERSGKLLIHTTGSAIVADHADGEYASAVPLTEDDYFDPVPYRRPRVDMNRYVRQAAIEKGVRSVVICPPMIYGPGRGLQHDSDQIPKLIALSRQVGAGVYFGKGLNRYSNVHIDDLVGPLPSRDGEGSGRVLLLCRERQQLFQGSRRDDQRRPRLRRPYGQPARGRCHPPTRRSRSFGGVVQQPR